jgi:hypothetical protein
MNAIKSSMITALALMGVPCVAAEAARVEGRNIRIEFNDAMHSRVVGSNTP